MESCAEFVRLLAVVGVVLAFVGVVTCQWSHVKAARLGLLLYSCITDACIVGWADIQSY